MVESAFGRRAEPEIPIQTLRHAFAFFGSFETLRPVRTAGPVADFTHWPNCAIPNPFTQQARGFRGLIRDSDLSGHAGIARDFGHAAGFIDGVGQRLLAKDMLALLHRRHGYGRVQVVGGAHDNGIEVLVLLEQLPEVAVGRAAARLAGTSLKTVVGVDDFLTWFAACNATGHLERMGQLQGLVGAEPIPATIDAQQFANGLAKLMRIPLRVIGAGPVGIADGDALHVGFTQKAQHDAQALRANADKRNIDLVARWNISRAAQHPTRYDGQAHRRRSGLP